MAQGIGLAFAILAIIFTGAIINAIFRSGGVDIGTLGAMALVTIALVLQAIYWKMKSY